MAPMILPVGDQRNAAARGNDVVQRQQVVGTRFLDRVLEHLARPPVGDRDTRLVLGDRNRTELRAVHPCEGNQAGAGIENRNVYWPAALRGLLRRRLDCRLRLLQRLETPSPVALPRTAIERYCGQIRFGSRWTARAGPFGPRRRQAQPTKRSARALAARRTAGDTAANDRHK